MTRKEIIDRIKKITPKTKYGIVEQLLDDMNEVLDIKDVGDNLPYLDLFSNLQIGNEFTDPIKTHREPHTIWLRGQVREWIDKRRDFEILDRSFKETKKANKQSRCSNIVSSIIACIATLALIVSTIHQCRSKDHRIEITKPVTIESQPTTKPADQD